MYRSDNDEFLISVIVPVYNSEKYINRCIDSIIGQTYNNLEIIIIDDGSTDSSGKICDDYACMDSRIRVFHKPNEGLASARKCGMKNATGKYVTFVDSDDYIDYNTYEILHKKTDECGPDIVAYNLVEDYPDHSVIMKNHFDEMVYNRQLIEERIFSQALSYGSFYDFGILPNLVSKMIKKEFLDENNISVSQEVLFGEDADATFQMLVKANSLQVIDYAPYHYCKRNDSAVWKPVSQEVIGCLENDLKTAFINSGFGELFLPQLNDYIKFVKLLKNPKVLLDSYWNFDESRIALYGAGGFGQAFYGSYKDNITVWVDSNYDRYDKIDSNVSVVSPELLVDKEEFYDIIFIAVLKADICREIEKKLQIMGVKKRIIYFKTDFSGEK